MFVLYRTSHKTAFMLTAIFQMNHNVCFYISEFCDNGYAYSKRIEKISSASLNDKGSNSIKTFGGSFSLISHSVGTTAESIKVLDICFFRNSLFLDQFSWKSKRKAPDTLKSCCGGALWLNNDKFIKKTRMKLSNYICLSKSEIFDCRTPSSWFIKTDSTNTPYS